MPVCAGKEGVVKGMDRGDIGSRLQEALKSLPHQGIGHWEEYYVQTPGAVPRNPISDCNLLDSRSDRFLTQAYCFLQTKHWLR